VEKVTARGWEGGGDRLCSCRAADGRAKVETVTEEEGTGRAVNSGLLCAFGERLPRRP